MKEVARERNTQDEGKHLLCARAPQAQSLGPEPQADLAITTSRDMAACYDSHPTIFTEKMRTVLRQTKSFYGTCLHKSLCKGTGNFDRCSSVGAKNSMNCWSRCGACVNIVSFVPLPRELTHALSKHVKLKARMCAGRETATRRARTLLPA